MNKRKRIIHLNDGHQLERLAYRQINSILSDAGHEFELYHLREGRYGIVIYKTDLKPHLEQAVKEARSNAYDKGMSITMIDAIKVTSRKSTMRVFATDLWLIEIIVRTAVKIHRCATGSASG